MNRRKIQQVKLILKIAFPPPKLTFAGLKRIIAREFPPELFSETMQFSYGWLPLKEDTWRGGYLTLPIVVD